MPTALELGGEEGMDNGRYIDITLKGREAAHLSVIVATGPHSNESVVALRRPNALDLVGGDAHADTSTADQNAEPSLALDNGPADFEGNIRVVHRVGGFTTIIRRSMTGLRLETKNGFLKLQTMMIATNGNVHNANLLLSLPYFTRDGNVRSTPRGFPAS